MTSLVLLACPVGMGLMMWMMMRGKKDDAPAAGSSRETPGDARSPASVELLREEHRRLGEQIEDLEADRSGKAAGS